MIVNYNVTVISPDGDTWSGEIADHSLPRSGELLTIVDPHPMGYTLPPVMRGIVSNLAWRWHNSVGHLTVLLMEVPEKHVTKNKNPCAEIELPDAGGNLPTEEIERLKKETEGIELRLAERNPLKRDRIQEGVDKAREMASSNPILELEVLLFTDQKLDKAAKALLRRVIRALKEQA